VNYTYDGDGNRLQKSSGKIYWYGAGTEILDESDLSGNFTNEYVFFAGKRVAMRNITAGTLCYYTEDMLGSSRTMVQAGQTSVCYDADFTPFGTERDVTDTCSQNYKYEGKERDTETNNVDFGARYYSFRFGRWLSADWSSVPAPVPYANLSNPQTLNLYGMVHDNPETFADLDGHGEIGMTNFGPGFPDALGAAANGSDGLGGDLAEGDQFATTFFAAQSARQSAGQSQPQPQSNRQPDGSYKATPAQLAEIKKDADHGKTTIGDGECVTACKRFTGVPGPTPTWRGVNLHPSSPTRTKVPQLLLS
jgi:RHS repeat-associated protein